MIYEYRGAVNTDPETAALIRDTIEAAVNAIVAPHTVSDRGWLLLVAAEARARAAMEKRRGNDPVKEALAA